MANSIAGDYPRKVGTAVTLIPPFWNDYQVAMPLQLMRQSDVADLSEFTHYQDVALSMDKESFESWWEAKCRASSTPWGVMRIIFESTGENLANKSPALVWAVLRGMRENSLDQK